MKKAILGAVIILVLLVFGVIYWKESQSQSELYLPTRPDNQEIYTFRINKDTQLQALVGNLEYYGFVKSKDALLKALKQSKDATQGNEGSIQVGDNTINREAEYKLSQSMDTWEIARVLLNEGTHQDCGHGCPPGSFYPEVLPGGDPAPTLSEQYEWVKTYEDCVEAKGQLSSEQYSEKTGKPRKCVSPDSREFTEGQEGWTEARGG